LFNALAEERALAWRASSAGLAPERFAWNSGVISDDAVLALTARGIEVARPIREPRAVTRDALAGADRVIALKEAEHRVMLEARFSGWESKVEYWHVHDVDAALPEQALAQIENDVFRLLAELADAST
jgi:protein-tyrosine-phosphatase